MAREKTADKRARALAVADRMNNYYGQAECALNYTSPFTLTIAVLLSAQTTDAGVNKVTPLLFEKYGTPETMAQANVEDVMDIIHSIGFYRNKAKNCIAAAQMIIRLWRRGSSHYGRTPASPRRWTKNCQYRFE